MRSFSEFIRTEEGRRACDPALLDRITATGDDITSLNNLIRFSRERFPDHFSDDPRKSLDRPCGADQRHAILVGDVLAVVRGDIRHDNARQTGEEIKEGANVDTGWILARRVG